jgi:hypothetical protein
MIKNDNIKIENKTFKIHNPYETYNATLSGKNLLAKISEERAKANCFLSV